MKSFTKSVFSAFDLGQGNVHSALLRCNRNQDIIFSFWNSNSRNEVMNAVDSTFINLADATSNGASDTKTGEAIIFAINHLLNSQAGRRSNVPGFVVIVQTEKFTSKIYRKLEFTFLLFYSVLVLIFLRCTFTQAACYPPPTPH